MTMCWNENSVPGGDEMMYDTANAKHGIEVMRNASKSEQPFFIALGIHREARGRGTRARACSLLGCVLWLTSAACVSLGIHRPHLPWDVPAHW